MENELIDWYNRYADELYNWAYFKTSSKETAEDLVQETFLSAAKAHKQFKNNSSAKTWLYTILNNKIVDHYRATAKRRARDQGMYEQGLSERVDAFFTSDGQWAVKPGGSSWENEPDLLGNPEFKRTMDSCMAELPESWRMAVSLKYLDNRKGREICQELGITQSNYWQIIHRAKLFLRDCLNNLWKSGL